MLWFYCDESFDYPQHQPKNYAVTGLLSDAKTFEKLESNWKGINDRFRVQRFHASPLNALDGEYQNWDKNTQVQYTKRMLRALRKRGANLQVTSIGIHADAMREFLSPEAQDRLGHPYIACFKVCIAMIAAYMRKLPSEYQCSVIFERNEHELEAIRVFNLIKGDPELGTRLASCTPGDWFNNVSLQASDLVAYESMRLIKGRRTGQKMRRAFQELAGFSGFMGYFFDKESIEDMKDQIENSTCAPGGYLPISRQFDPEYVEGDTWEDVERKQGLRR
jgi:hypothetical protein